MEQGILESESVNSEEENQGYVDVVLDKYPRIFKEVFLEEGSNAAVLYNDARVSQEEKESFPDYRYLAVSKYGLTMFNTSSKRPLGYELTRKTILKLIELSDGSEVRDLVVSEWNNCKRNRINKGFFPLEKILRSVTVSGKNVKEGVKEFYSTVSEIPHSMI